MRSFKNKNVIITGAAGDVGKNLAKKIAKHEANLILSDVNLEGLQELKNDIESTYDTKVRIDGLDITNEQKVKIFSEEVLKEFGSIDLLINNAGIGHYAELAETSIETWKQLLEVNLWGALYHVHAFLPSMIERESGHIVNVSSGQAFFRMPTWGAYAVTKLAMGAYSEVLRHEVKKFNINVTTCYPYMINTGFYNEIPGENFFQKLSMKMLPFYSMSPERVSNILFKAIKKNKAIEMVSPMNNFGKASHFVPKMWDVVSTATAMTLGKKADQVIPEGLKGKPTKKNKTQ